VISVVTPALDAAAFIAQTLVSVHGQGGRFLEHLVIDGGSRDGTAELVRASGARLIEAPGAGQAAAVNLGVAQARGEIVVVLNADDVLYPGALARIEDAFAREPQAAAIFGDADYVDRNGAVIGRYPSAPFDRATFAESCTIPHPASGVRRSAFTAVGGMDERLHFALDYEFWMRLSLRHRIVKIDALLAATRMHPDAKTLARRDAVYREAVAVLRRHYGYVPYTWAYAYASWLLDRRDQFFAPARPSRRAVLASLGLGLWLNPTRPARFIADWFGHRALGSR
jgi:glycosyltransferase involved in cell wall biosynthesis